MPDPIRVALVNDYELVVAGIAAVLQDYPERVEIVELDAGVPVTSKVDVVLYDTFARAQAHEVDVEDLLGDSGARLLVFTWNCTSELVDQALDHGVAGCVSKGLAADDLVDAIEQTAARQAGDEPLVRCGADGPDDRFGRWPGDQLGLSARESEVLALICQGLSNQEITERAFIGINTVKTYIRTLYRKIGVASRTQAVLWGLAHGFEPDRSSITLEDPAS